MQKDLSDAQVKPCCGVAAPIGLTLNEVAARFGVSTKHLLRMIQADAFPKPYKLGALNRWDLQRLAEWSAQQSDTVNLVRATPTGSEDGDMDATVLVSHSLNVPSEATEIPKVDRRRRVEDSKQTDSPFKPLSYTAPVGSGRDRRMASVTS